MSFGEHSRTRIGSSAFRSCDSIYSVSIPEGVRSIESGAFDQCVSLASITLPSSVTRIDTGAIWYCPSLESISVDSNNTVYDSRNNCNAIIHTYSNHLLCGCKNTIIPNSVTCIERDAFYGCTSLSSIAIPSSVTTIGMGAFGDCSSLSFITIPNSVTDIGIEAFWQCSSLNSITIPESVSNIAFNTFSGCSALSSVVLPHGLTSIENYAFQGCSSLASIVLPSSLTSIGDHAFFECTSLTSISIPSSVVYIGNAAFSWNESLTSVTIESPSFVSTTANLGSIFGSQVTSYTIGDSVTTIGDLAFYKCTGMTSVSIGKSVTSIGNKAFNGCTNLKTVYNKSSLYFWKGSSSYGYIAYYADTVYNGEIVGDFVIQSDTILSGYIGQGGDVIIPDGITEIDAYTFQNDTNIISVTIPSSMTHIGGNAFYGCTGLSTITIPTSVTSISNDAFQGCSNLTSVVWKAINCTSTSKQGLFYSSRESISSFVLGDSVQIIPQDLCYNMTELSHVSIPNTVTSIGNYAFCHCTGLTSIEIPSTVNSIGLAAFTDCSGVTAIVVENGNEVYDSRNNCNAIIERATNTLIYGCQNTQIPDSIVIDTDAFRNCIGLTSITIPQSVTSFGRSSFYGCTNLKTVHNHTSLTMVKGSSNYGYVAYYADSVYNGFIEGDFVIQNDTIVTAYLGTSNDMVIPNKITRIGENAFSTRTGLNSVIIGPAVTTIGNSAFAGCTKLRHITCYALNPPSANANSFANYNVNLYVPCDNLDDYKFDVVFGSFKYLQCIGAEETSTTTTTVTPSNNDATFTWPTADNAVTYTLTITKNGIVFCTLTFNVYGQLTNIAFAPGRNSARHSGAAELTATGYQFTVTGLESGTSYDYSVIVSDANGNTIANYSGAFSTSGTPTNTESILMNSAAQKFLRNGQVLIRRGDNIYNMQGQVVE